VELMGRPFSDARLVAFAFAYEQGGARRRPPPTTPALVNGKAPAAKTMVVTAGTAESGASVSFTFDPATSVLSYSARATGTKPASVQAVVLRRSDGTSSTSPKRVIARVLGPDMASGSGKMRLLGDELAAFQAGRITVAVFGDKGADPLGERTVVPR
jgi:amidase